MELTKHHNTTSLSHTAGKYKKASIIFGENN